MSVRYEVFADAEAICSGALRDAAIAELDERVYSSVPASPTFPLAVVERIGGVPAERHHLDRARVQVTVWGESKSQAHDIAQEARVVLHELEGTTVTDPVSAFITAVDDDLGLTWQPDPATARDRYLFGIALFTIAPTGGS